MSVAREIANAHAENLEPDAGGSKLPGPAMKIHVEFDEVIQERIPAPERELLVHYLEILTKSARAEIEAEAESLVKTGKAGKWVKFCRCRPGKCRAVVVDGRVFGHLAPGLFRLRRPRELAKNHSQKLYRINLRALESHLSRSEAAKQREKRKRLGQDDGKASVADPNRYVRHKAD